MIVQEDIDPELWFKGTQEFRRQLQYAGVLDECCFNNAPSLTVDICRVKACRIVGLPEDRCKISPILTFLFYDRLEYIRLCLNMQKPRNTGSKEN